LYDGSNNGRLAMSARRLAELIPCNKDTASKILRCLEDAGLIEAVKVGHYAKKEEERIASEYRLTHFRCDATHELQSKRYNPPHRWQPSEPIGS
jgi:DNA-binding transcriptional regulator YhcF (GntR family)